MQAQIQPGRHAGAAQDRALVDVQLYWLNKLKSPRQAANDFAEELVALGANGESARFVSSGVGDDFDLTKPLGANAGPMGDTGSDTGAGPDIAPPPPAPKAPAEGAKGGSDEGYNCACGGGGEFEGGETRGEDEWIDPTDLIPF